jgi:hypothetical protein
VSRYSTNWQPIVPIDEIGSPPNVKKEVILRINKQKNGRFSGVIF